MKIQELNEFYLQLDGRADEIQESFLETNGDLDCWSGWYSDQYFRNAKNEFERYFFPIPVITLDKIAVINVSPKETMIYTYHNKREAKEIDFDQFNTFNVVSYVVDIKEPDYTDFGKSAKPSKKKASNNQDQDFVSFLSLRKMLKQAKLSPSSNCCVISVFTTKGR